MKKILFVDDSLTLREIASQVFSKLPYELVLAGSDENALSAYEAGTFDLVVLDAGMMQGSFSRRIGAMGLPPGPSSRLEKVLLLCSSFHPYDVSSDQRTSICAVTKKPFEVVPFLDLVEGLLRGEVPHSSVEPLHSTVSAEESSVLSPTFIAESQNVTYGIPTKTPLMPRPPFLARAPVPACVFAALMDLAQKGKAYEAIAQLSAETIADIAWEVVPALARTMMTEISTKKE